ncbi:MAG TPA: DUF899 domain-containing protein [Solirubrobacteraceae bacterium]|nr:DUF899 domain-containing protein [Solirubrobacteraceae bacterium]
MALPEIASPEQWVTARAELLRAEKELTRARDALTAARRGLPMVEVTEDYRFDGPDGDVGLADLFEGRSQLIVGHFMFDPEWEDGCSSCSAGADEMSPGHLTHLHARDTTFAYVSRAPYEKIAAYKAKRGWTFPWYSSHGSAFNYDYGVTLDPEVAPMVYNYRPAEAYAEPGGSALLPGEYPGRSSFLRVGGRVFHTYSVYARGLETIGGSYYLLDETALGRQEDWEEPRGRVQSVRGARPDFAP